jgi:hypothetical protein
MDMGPTIREILPLAIGVAISPIPIIAVILMLFGPKARRTGPAFALGWVGALLLVGGIVLIVADGGDISTDEAASDAVYWSKLLLGLLFLALAIRQWRSRPKEGEEPEMPKWMSAIDQFTPGRAFGLAGLLAGVNPKNLGLTLAAGTTIAQAGLAGGENWLALIVFVALASVSVATPVVYYLVASASAEHTLNAMKAWLLANNATVMFVLFLILGVKLIGDGLGSLTS